MKIPVRVVFISAGFYLPLLFISTSYFNLSNNDVWFVLLLISVGCGYLVNSLLKRKKDTGGEKDEEENQDTP